MDEQAKEFQQTMLKLMEKTLERHIGDEFAGSEPGSRWRSAQCELLSLLQAGMKALGFNQICDRVTYVMGEVAFVEMKDDPNAQRRLIEGLAELNERDE